MRPRWALFFAFIVTVISACCVINYLGNRAELNRWFSGNSNAHVTGLRLASFGSEIVVTNPVVLLSIEKGIQSRKFAPGPHGCCCGARIQLNGRWRGPIAFSVSEASIIIGIPSSAFPLEREYQYAEFRVSKTSGEVLNTSLQKLINAK